MKNHIKSIEIIGLFGRFRLKQTFFPGINILYGKNGSGKTVILHILANALNGDFERFAYLRFDFIRIELTTNVTISFKQTRNIASLQQSGSVYKLITLVEINDQTHVSFESIEKIYGTASTYELVSVHTLPNQNTKIISTAYFPAFREMLEAWNPISILEAEKVEVDRERLEEIIKEFDAYNMIGRAYDISSELYDAIQYKTRKTSLDERMTFARNIFGNFVPNLNYLSTTEIQEDMVRTINDALRIDDISISSPVEIHENNKRKIQKELDAIIKEFTLFIKIVNKFLEGKKILIQLLPSEQPEIIFFGARLPENTLPLKLQFKNDNRYSDFKVLSSGERQLITILYAASQVSEHDLILIDEPELSFHVDWQRKLLDSMSALSAERQIIVCTHSPIIGANHTGRTIKINLDFI